MKLIKVGPKHFAKVDDDTFHELNKIIWHYQHGYARSNGPNKDRFYMHRIILNAPTGKVVDHINGDKLDNRKDNLRICNQSVNGLNRTKNNLNNTSGFRGISYDKTRNKYRVHLKINYKQKYLGRFNSIEEAKDAYEKANLNII